MYLEDAVSGNGRLATRDADRNIKQTTAERFITAVVSFMHVSSSSCLYCDKTFRNARETLRDVSKVGEFLRNILKVVTTTFYIIGQTHMCIQIMLVLQ